jgi:hypothetical protein
LYYFVSAGGLVHVIHDYRSVLIFAKWFVLLL